LRDDLVSQGVTDVNIIAIDGSQFGNGPDQLAGMAALGDLPLVQETAAEMVWTAWNAQWRDLIILDRNGRFAGKLNLTAFDPDPSVNGGQNYSQLRTMLIAVRDI
jgi:hypothetical protein